MAERKNGPDSGWRRVWGLILLPLCLFISLGLFSYDWKDISLLQAPPNSPPGNLIGPVGAWFSFILLTVSGIGAYLLPLWCLVMGVLLLADREPLVWLRGLWSALVALALVLMLDLTGSWWTPFCDRLNIVDAGGLLGRLVMRDLLVRWFSPVGASIVVISLFVVAMAFLVGVPAFVNGSRVMGAGILNAVKRASGSLAGRGGHEGEAAQEEVELVVEQVRRKPGAEPEEDEEPAAPAKTAGRKAEEPEEPEETAEPEPPKTARKAKPPPEPEPPEEEPPAEEKEAQDERDVAQPAANPDYRLPPLSLLNDVPVSASAVKIDTTTTATVLVETLKEFGIDAEVTNVEKGPVVTSYQLLPAPGIRVEKIAALSNNLALALKATSIRVQAPIPGKGVVGIEVPNSVAKMVFLREMLESQAWRSEKIKIPLVLGKDVTGVDLIADLADMPHLLIAGATGSGKTVCMNSILAGLLMARTPQQLRLLLVDPKIVEFAVFNHLPHLVAPVITDPKKVSLGLRWAINEMEKRYKLFARAGVRNIESYNTREVAKQQELFAAETEPAENEPPDRLPYIVLIIDELADLMLAAQADIENGVARLAQLSRAVGIHMILSTQRPSVNVITGTIKANFPSRIGFQVAQKVDSRTILDAIGAEKLLGRGDMLFLPPGTSKMVRAQGAMTTDEEIHRIVDFIKQQAQPDYLLEIKEKAEGGQGGGGGDDDEPGDALLEQSIQIIRETKRASTSSLQRRLRIGYTRAARIMDILEERGIIGPPRGSEPREILIDLDGAIPDNPPATETDAEEKDP